VQKNNHLEQLIYLFSKLPGLGQRSARRIVLHLLQDKDIRLKSLYDAIGSVQETITTCNICANIDSEQICSICCDEGRDKSVIAIVETVAELWAIERSGIFKGLYHVLGSSLSASSYTNSKQLRLEELRIRCEGLGVKELIIATNATLDGQTTAYFITEFFKDSNIHISRLASGVPVGGELDYLDDGTLSAAIMQRQSFT
jgi:recombination protein RecR